MFSPKKSTITSRVDLAAIESGEGKPVPVVDKTADFMNVRFDMFGADMAGVHGHPQRVMEEHGFHVTKGDPISIADCWIFQIVPPYPEGELPEWLKRIRDDHIFYCDQ